jgi:hypothetical protein
VRLGDRFEVLAINTLSDQSFIASPIIGGENSGDNAETGQFGIALRFLKKTPALVKSDPLTLD